MRRIFLSLLMGAGALLSPISARGHEAGTPDCMETASTNDEYRICTQLKISKADARLNDAWKRLFQSEGGSRTPAGRALLVEQRAWLAFRSKACAEYFLPGAGREAQVIHGPLCIAEVINTRANDLNGRYELMNP